MMKVFVGFACILSLLTGGLAVGENGGGGDIFAVLIAGSNTYSNYRHQANVAHAWHVLTEHGVKADNIITLMYDDVANDQENPFPGKLFNQPDGPDVYQAIKIDYTGDDVTAENFMAVMKGDEKAVKGGNGRVLKSGKNDKVFVYFTDHGASGHVMVIDELLTALQLNQTLQAMHDKGLYGELVLYLEACFSGSMLEGILPSDVNILALTSANPNEETAATYCDVPGLEDTCLGDEFSVGWMEDSDTESLNNETLEKQYEVIKSGMMYSHASKHGDLRISREFVGNFQGSKPSLHQPNHIKTQQQNSARKSVQWPAREIPLRILESRLERANEPAKRVKLEKQIDELKMKRAYHDAHTRALIQKLLKNSATSLEFVLSHKPTRIINLECHHEAIHAYHTKCFNLGRNPYAMKVAGPLANLCAQGVSSESIVSGIHSHCQQKDVRMENIQ